MERCFSYKTRTTGARNGEVYGKDLLHYPITVQFRVQKAQWGQALETAYKENYMQMKVS